MAQIEWVHERLLAWAERVTVGDGDGYAAVNVLHPNWSPPAKGSRPSPKISLGRGAEIERTHQAVRELGLRLRNTVVLLYCRKLSPTEAAVRLDCSERTVHDRIARAHQQLAEFLQIAVKRL